MLKKILIGALLFGAAQLAVVAPAAAGGHTPDGPVTSAPSTSTKPMAWDW
ncbi:hypothetical protein [Amycolatopsis coloradensis]|nr:hypothetical protein [Amycolatopsis coloradensis]